MNLADHVTCYRPSSLSSEEIGEPGPPVDQLYQALYRFALCLTRDACQAADLTQQAFYLRALRGHQLRDGQKVKGWLRTTLYREFLRDVRRKTQLIEVEFQESFASMPTAEPEGPSAADGAAAVQALDAVSEPFRTALRLFYLENLSYEEIARALGIPVGTVMSRLFRGREELRARFHGEL